MFKFYDLEYKMQLNSGE